MLERLLLAVVLLLPAAVLGQTSSAPRPEIKVGDSWTYTRFDKTTKQITGTFVNTVAKIEGGEITMESRSASGQGGGGSNVFTPEWHVRKLGGREFTPAIPEYAFPLEVGKSWAGKYTAPSPRGDSIVDYELKGKVVGVESVTVPAGTFDAMKIELETFWVYKGAFGRVGGGLTTGSFNQTIWYAPKAKRFVKMDVDNYSAISQERVLWELTELKLN